MQPVLIMIAHTFLLCVAVCIDTFVTCFGFGIDRIRIPMGSALVLSIVSAGTLALTIFAAGWMSPYLPASLVRWLSCLLLCGLGFFQLFGSAFKKWIRRLTKPGKELSFSFLQMRFLLRVWADPATADTDHSRVLSASESIALGLALSSARMAAGFGGGFSGLNALGVFLCCSVMNLLCILAGGLAGQKTANRIRFDLSWLSGGILLLMGLAALY